MGGQPTQIAVAPSSGNLFIAGSADGGLTTTAGAFQSTYGGAGDAFLTIMDPSGTFTLYTTYIGGSGLEIARGVAADASEDAYVTGSTLSDDFPVTPGVFQFERPAGNNESAFVTRVVPLELSPTATPTTTPTASSSPISTVMFPPTLTPTRTPLPTRTLGGPTPDATPSVTPASTATMTPATTPTATVISTASGASPTVTITATMTATPTITATPTVTATATPTPVGNLKMLPVRMNFRGVRVGKTSAPKLVQVINPKRNQGAVTITGVVLASHISGTPSGFAIDLAKSSCAMGGSIARGKKCRVAITFAPLNGGAKTDSLLITGNVSNSGQPVSLAGVGR